MLLGLKSGKQTLYMASQATIHCQSNYSMMGIPTDQLLYKTFRNRLRKKLKDKLQGKSLDC